MKVDKKRIIDRFGEIRRRLKRLRQAAKINKVKFLTDDVIYTATERNLQVAVQACLDISNHLVAKINLEKPKKDNKEVFSILAKHKVIPVSLAEKLKKMAGQRNILVHEYLEIEKDIIYKTINDDLKDITAFVKHIQKFLDKS
jgi:uncharacterized protein YutE (UPF0331/DUF86 family)